MAEKWTLAEAVDLCVMLYPALSQIGYFPALTGGCLYKPGERKDCDIVIYPHLQMEGDIEALALMLHLLGISDRDLETEPPRLSQQRWCTLAQYKGKRVDLLLPQFAHGEYPQAEISDGY